MRIAYLTVSDPKDKRSWSGIHYNMYSSLIELGLSVELIGPLNISESNERRLRRLNALLHLTHNKLKLGKISYSNTTFLSRVLTKEAETKLENTRFDLIFAPASSAIIAHLRTDTPIVYYSDATISLLIDYYPNYIGLSAISRLMAKTIEKRAIRKSRRQVFSSHWALQSAKGEFSATNAFVVPFGANLLPQFEINTDKTDSTWNLLFVGVDWTRKGGDLVLDAVDLLIKMGKNVSLTVVGCTPPTSHSALRVFPFLDKNKPEDLNRLQKIFAQADLLVLPTRADCSPIVICEAYAFSTPVIAPCVGGIGELIDDGVTGTLLSPASSAQDYCNAIKKILDDPQNLQSMKSEAKKRFDKELNWQNWARQMKKIFVEAIY